MYGAIIGDLAGSIYEYDQTKCIKSINMNNLIEDNSFYSDDTILTMAIIDAIKDNKDYDKYLRKYINDYKDYKPNFSPYFKSSFSPGLIKWSKSNEIGTSHGNGCMMRVSGVGYLFNTEDEVIENSYLSTIPSHNSIISIYSSKIIALIIFYLRNGLSREEIYKKLNLNIEYKPFIKFNTTCEETLGNCLYAFYYSNSFEDAIKKTLLMGGDTDTNACIVGSMAYALFDVSDEIIKKVNSKIPNEFVKLIKK